jgi:excisionase family DNA binding protein
MTRPHDRHHDDPHGPNGLAEGSTTTLPHGHTPAAAVPLLPLLLSLTQAAVLLGVSARTLKRLVAGDDLPEGAVTRIGRRRLLNRLVLERWVAAGCPPPPGRRRRPR